MEIIINIKRIYSKILYLFKKEIKTKKILRNINSSKIITKEFN